MSQFVSVLFLVFLLKLLAIGLTAHLINKKYNDIFGSLLGGWLLCQTFLIGCMLLASCFSALSMTSMWTALILLNVILCVLTSRETKLRKANFLEYKQFSSFSAGLSLSIVMVIFLFLTYRSFYFYDNTLDALTYGLTRLDFYEQAKSLFIVEPTQAFNIFSNEWNGELNALFYMLTTGNEQASSFGNVEIWLLSFLTFSWLSGILGFEMRIQCLIGLLLSTVPVLLGLTMTVKGDLLCIVSFAMAFGFSLLMLRNPKSSTFTPIFLFAAAGMASGAKITVLPFIGLIVILMAAIFIINSFFILKIRPGYQSIIILLTGLMLFCIGNSRYFLNYFAYGELFKHLEAASFSLKNIPENIKGLIQTSFKLQSWGVLGYGFGALTFFLFVGFFLSVVHAVLSVLSVFRRQWSRQLPSIYYILFFLFFCTGFGFLLINLHWYPWAFRYFTPYLMVIALLLLVSFLRLLSLSRFHSGLSRVWIGCILCIVIVNSYCVFSSNGEAFPIDFRTALNQSEIERKISLHAYLGNFENGLKSITDKKSHHTILVFNEINSIVLPFFGERHQNTIELVSSLADFKEKASQKKYDMAVITLSTPGRKLDIDLSGYILKNTSPFWIIFKS